MSLSNEIPSSPKPRSRIGAPSSSGPAVPLAPTAATGSPVIPANAFPDMSKNAVAGTVRLKTSSSPCAATTASAAASDMFMNITAPSSAGESVELSSGIDEPLLREISMPAGLNADASMYSSNASDTVPRPRSRIGPPPSGICGRVVSSVVLTARPEPYAYHPRLPAG